MTRIAIRQKGRDVTITFKADPGEACENCGGPLKAGERVGISPRTDKPSHLNERRCKTFARARGA